MASLGFTLTVMGPGMSNRDDDRFNSPEGNGMSEEGQRKAALAQGSVDGGGAAEEKSGGQAARYPKGSDTRAR